MFENFEKGYAEAIFESLGTVIDSVLAEAYFTDSADALRKLKKSQKKNN